MLTKRGRSTSCIFPLVVAAALSGAKAHGAEPSSPDHRPDVATYFQTHVAKWVGEPEIVEAIRAQNEKTSGLSQAEIDELDAAWQAEVGSDDNDRPFVEEVMARDVSAYLKARQREADWMIVEIILMDARGLNVGLSTPSSDFWQGDEAKHQDTYQAASRDLHIDEVEYEAETRLLLSQVNSTIFDPVSGEPIGAVTVSLNMNKL